MTTASRTRSAALALCLLAALSLAFALRAPAAHASKSQEVTFEAPRDLFDPAKREAAFQEIDSLGAHALRIVLYWNDVAPDHDSRVKPKLDMADPSVYDWSKYQPVLDEAKARGWTVQVTASGPVPGAGTASRRTPSAVSPASRPYSPEVLCPNCHGPSISFPRQKYFTP